MPSLELLLVLALSFPARPGTASLQRACRAVLGLCCRVDSGDVSSVCSLAAAVAPWPPLVSPAPHMAGQVAGGKSLPLLLTESGRCSLAGKQVSLQLECRPGFP